MKKSLIAFTACAFTFLQEGPDSGWESTFLLAGIIQKVYKNAFQKKIREGAFILLNAGEIPEESFVLLNELEQNPDWYIGKY